MSELNPNIDKYVVVRDKATGQLVSLDSMKKFNSALHEKLEPVKEVEPESKNESPDWGLNRFKELTKMKAWLRLDLKEEYNKLKEVYGEKE